MGFSFHYTADKLDKILAAHPEAKYVPLLFALVLTVLPHCVGTARTARGLGAVDVHPRRMRFAVALNMAEKFPAVAFVEGNVIRDEIQRVDPALFHIVAGVAEQRTRDSVAALVLLGVYGADV